MQKIKIVYSPSCCFQFIPLFPSVTQNERRFPECLTNLRKQIETKAVTIYYVHCLLYYIILLKFSKAFV